MKNIIRLLSTVTIVSVLFMSQFFVHTTEVNAEEEISVKSFGATGEGEIDETNFIQKAINFKSENGGGSIYFPKGTYLINAVKSIVLKNNITLKFEEGTVLKAIPNESEAFQILKIHDVTNVNLVGKVKIQGERYDHLAPGGEWGMGISIRGSKNIRIENPIITDNWGDGIYIGSTANQNYSENIQIINPVMDNNRRQGISIISAKNLEIANAIITNTKGTMPQGGIAIEPNNNYEFLENININHLFTANNAGKGLLIYPGKLGGTNPVSIFVNETGEIKDGYAVKGIEKLRGEIRVGGYYYLTDREVVSIPIVKVTDNNATRVKGYAQAKSKVTVKAGANEIGSATANALGEFAVPIAKKQIGTELEIFATDEFGNKSVSVFAKVEAAKYKDFSSDHWASEEVFYLTDKKILTGYPDITFISEESVTRAQAAKMLSIALNLPVQKSDTVYKDVSASHWAKDYIAAATKADLFNGYSDGTFRPDVFLTRAEMAKILVLAYKFEGESPSLFSDISNSWAQSYIIKLTENRIATGFPDNTFKPNEATTRAQFSVFLARSMDVKFR